MKTKKFTIIIILIITNKNPFPKISIMTCTKSNTQKKTSNNIPVLTLNKTVISNFPKMI